MKQVLLNSQYVLDEHFTSEELRELEKLPHVIKYSQGFPVVYFYRFGSIICSYRLYSPEEYDDLESLRYKCSETIRQQRAYWLSMKEKIWPHYPDNMMCIWLDKRASPPIMLHKWGEIDSLFIHYDVSEVAFWDALDNMMKDILALNTLALDLLKRGQICHCRWMDDNEEIACLKNKLNQIRFENYYTKPKITNPFEL